MLGNGDVWDAGPLGSLLGMLISMAVMLVIARNYHYLMCKYPGAGGVYTYAKKAFGYDHGFLTAWFVAITYLAILWANATSVPLFAHYFMGDTFRFGYLYTIFGYDVYFGEALLSIVAVILFGLLCISTKRIAAKLMVVLAVAFTAGIIICFASAMGGLQGNVSTFNPAFLPDNSAFIQVITIACISPWAFIGFENISHMSGEFKFDRTASFKILVASVVATTALYVFVILLSTTAYPAQFDSWLDYVQNLDSMQGIEGLPAFYAAYHYLGSTGVNLLFVALFALIATSLIGNITALSRLLYALAQDGILSQSLTALNKGGSPYRAILAIMAVSCAVPFLGRTAIGWIVDVTTIGATITYGFVSASTYKIAAAKNDKLHKWLGLIGLVVMIAMGLTLTLPNLFGTATLAAESYFIITAWALLGLLFFRKILRSDPDGRFGESLIVWVVLLAFVLFMSCVWMDQSSENAANAALADLQAHYESNPAFSSSSSSDEAYYQYELSNIRYVNTLNTLVMLGLFALSLGVLLSNYSFMRKRENESVLQLGLERMRANTDELTRIRNKHAYSEIEQDLEMRIKQDPSLKFAIAICDLNDLKTINDTRGHGAGDEAIINASRWLCDVFAHSPVFRVGGDEFAVIVEGQDYDNRSALLEEINRQSEENLVNGGIVISVGMSDYLGNGESASEVYNRADALMYNRKRALKERTSSQVRA